MDNNTPPPDTTTRDIRSLMAMHELMVHNIGFDREDEKQIEQAMLLYRTSDTDPLFREHQVRMQCTRLRHMEAQLLYRIRLLEMAEKQFRLSHERHQGLFEFLTRKQVALMNKLNAVRTVVRKVSTTDAPVYTFRSVSKEIQSYHDNMRYVASAVTDQDASVYLQHSVA